MKKKLTAVALVVCMLAIMLVGASLAYFTDKTDTAENTFTVGNVDIKLTEDKWNKNDKHNFMPGTTFDKDPTIVVESGSEDCWVFMEVEMNKFNSWLRLLAIQNDNDNLNLFEYNTKDGKDCGEGTDCQGHLNADGIMQFFSTGAYQDAFNDWFGGVDHNAWKIMNLSKVLDSIKASWKDSNIKVINPIFGYKTVLKADEEATLFTSVTMPASVTSEQLADSRFNTSKAEWKLKITGYAIQKENIDTLDKAYTALFDK